MTAKVLPLPVRTRLVCSACGADGEGTCGCGAPYVPPGERAEAEVKKNPEKSDRTIAAELGVSRTTVRRARKSGGPYGPPEKKRKGRDGKSYTTKPRASKPKSTPKTAGSMKAEVNQLLKDVQAINDMATAIIDAFETIAAKYPTEMEVEDQNVSYGAKAAIMQCLYSTGDQLYKLAQQIDGR